MRVDSDGRVLHVRRREVVEISLFDLPIFECDRALGHQLNEAERQASLDLTFDRERIDGEPQIDRRRRAVNARSAILHRHIDRQTDCRPETFVHGNAAACANRESRRRRAWNLLLRTSRDDRTPLELFLASVRGWDGSMRRRFAGCNLQSH